MHTFEPWLQTRLNKPSYCFATGLSCVKVHQDETEGLSLQLGRLRVQRGRGGVWGACSVCAEELWKICAGVLKLGWPHIGVWGIPHGWCRKSSFTAACRGTWDSGMCGTAGSGLLDPAEQDDPKTLCALQPALSYGCGWWECVEELFLLSPVLLCHIALQSFVSLQATAALLPGGLWLSLQQGIPGAGVSSLNWCVLANHYSKKHNCSLEFSQSCCTNACA